VRPSLKAVLVLAIAAAPTALLVGAPARAATDPKACPTKGTATASCLITWTGSTFSPVKTSVRAGVSVVFHNANSGALARDVTVSGTKPTKFSVKITPGASSKAQTLAGTETVSGQESGALGNSGTATITVVPAPTTPPTTKPPTSSPKPKPSTHSTTPATSPAPQPTGPALGVTNAPPLGIGVLAPTASPAGPGPQVAGPDDLFGGPTPTPTPVAEAPRALAQSVPARKYGLPGALAAVLLTGVVVGVVRLARVDLGNGHHIGGNDTTSTDDASADGH
jgi:hypothetical protein